MSKYVHQKCACFVVHMSIRRHDTRYGNLAAYAHMRSCAHVYTHVYIRVHTHFYKYGYPHMVVFVHKHASARVCRHVRTGTPLDSATPPPLHFDWEWPPNSLAAYRYMRAPKNCE